MNQEKSKPKIELFEFDGLGIIILFPSGVIYTNQIAGYACLHPEVEGVFVPLSVGHKKILFALQNHFTGSWNHLEEKDAEIVDKLLRSDEFDYIKVDRSKLKDSFESWVYLELKEFDELYPLINGFGESAKAVLTWANSD